MSAVAGDPITTLQADELATLRAVADRLIPADGQMPSAAGVLSDARLRFVLTPGPTCSAPSIARSAPSSGTTSTCAWRGSGGTSPRRWARSNS